MSDLSFTDRLVREERKAMAARLELAVSILTNVAYGAWGASILEPVLTTSPPGPGHYILGIGGFSAAFLAMLLVPKGRLE